MGMLVKLIGTLVFKEEVGSGTKFYVSPMFVTMFESEGKKWDKNAMIAVVITQREFDKNFITPEMIRPTANWSEMRLETYQGQEMYSITYTPKKEEDVRVSHKKSIEIEAESLEEARKRLESQMPEGFQLLSEQVISDGKPKTVKAIADTTEAAFAKAQGEMPDGASVLERKVLVAPERQVITVEAADEQGAKSSAKFWARSQFGSTAPIVEGLRLTVAGRKGFLGIGAKPNQYEVEMILQQAVVEITFRTKAKISAELRGRLVPEAVVPSPQKVKARYDQEREQKVEPEVEQFIHSLGDKDKSVRKAAAEALGQIGDARAVEPLIALIKKENAKWSSTRAASEADVCEVAVRALGRIGAPAVEPLIAALKDNNDWVRSDAAEALGNIGAPAVQSLMAALKDNNWLVRSEAVRALGKIGDVRTVEPLIAALKDDPWQIRDAATWALGRIGDPRAVEPLIAALSEGATLWGAIVALGRIGDPRAVEPLVNALKHKNLRIRIVAVEALEQIGDEQATEALRKLKARPERATREEIDPVVERHIRNLKDKSEQVRADAASALGEIGDPQAIEPLIAALRDGTWSLCLRVSEALEWIGLQLEDDAVRARATELLVQILRDESSQWRDFAAKVLGVVGDSQAVEPLIHALGDTGDNTRSWAAEALGKIGDERAVEPLSRALEDEREHVRRAAAGALEKIEARHARAKEAKAEPPKRVTMHVTQRGHEREEEMKVEPEVEQHIRDLRDEDKEVRRWAAEALGKIGNTLAIDPLIRALGDQYPEVREEAAKALGKIGDARAIDSLIRVSGDRDPVVRWAAVSALGEIGDMQAVEPLNRALGDQYKEVRDAAVRALGKIKEKWEAVTETEEEVVTEVQEPGAKRDFDIGILCFDDGRYDEAIAAFTRALESDSEHADAYYNRGNAYSCQGRYDEAIADFDKAIALRPERAEAYNNRGNAYRQRDPHDRGNNEQAIRDYTRSLELGNPEPWHVHLNRGIAFFNLGNEDRAIADYSKAIELDSQCFAAYQGRGFVYMLRGQRAEAIRDLERFLKLAPAADPQRSTVEVMVQQLRSLG